ncbi:hypothetical protein [Vulcanisaeta distributa]|nr:hypothetical protein [Vulcanisaeta distributa]
MVDCCLYDLAGTNNEVRVRIINHLTQERHIKAKDLRSHQTT